MPYSFLPFLLPVCLSLSFLLFLSLFFFLSLSLSLSLSFFLFFLFLFFETGSHYVALAVLELTISLCRLGWPRTQKSTCLCLPNAGIKFMHNYTWIQCHSLSIQKP
ncbi:mCG1042069 [Mus musculus]|nr:mCG1042069 [Mus musculus]